MQVVGVQCYPSSSPLALPDSDCQSALPNSAADRESPSGVCFALPASFDSEGSSGESSQAEAPPCVRAGISANQGRRSKMEDVSLAVDNISDILSQTSDHLQLPGVAAFYAVFDGHNGVQAAEFARERILTSVLTSGSFPDDIETSMASAFLQVDQDYLAATCAKEESAGTTALTALVWGSQLYVANAGDCRAVISRRGRALELTRDHKPHDPDERRRIELCGGYVCGEGLLCGELAVARALGDHHLAPPLKGAEGPLIAHPDLVCHSLHPHDEFLLLGSDGLWDVFPSQRAIEYARQRLLYHNDPQRCAEELVAEALRMHTSDNVTCIAVCFGEKPPQRRVFKNSGIGGGRSNRNVSTDGYHLLAQLLGTHVHL